ncbi:MAG: GNAT family N-acetyltransferase [Magnetospiraceae bacterium]
MIIRPFASEDLPVLLAVNTQALPAVNQIDAAEMRWLTDNALATLVAESPRGIAGFMIALGPGLDYDSDNYRWFSPRYPRFSYVDRVVVADGFRGAGVGEALYGELARLSEGRAPVILCEVNERPPNPGSLRFHQRLGFRIVGRQETEGGKKQVALMEKTLDSFRP